MDIDQIVEKIRKDMPKDLNEIEIAKYIYIQLGKIKSYDEKYYFGNRKTKDKIYKLAKSTPSRLDETMKKRRIICVSLSHLYVELLKRFDIKSRVHKFSSLDPHVYTLIYLKSGLVIKADLQNDLPRIQTGMKTKKFGTKDFEEFYELFEEISDEENIEIDKKIGYVKDENDYRDKDIENLKEKCKGKDAIEATNIIMNDKKVNNLPKGIGYLERDAYYINLFRMCIERRNFDIVHCYKYIKDEEGNEDKKYKMILSVYGKHNKQLVYAFSESNNKFLSINPMILKQVEMKESKDKNNTYWCKTENFSGVKKMMHMIQENEKECKKQDFTK